MNATDIIAWTHDGAAYCTTCRRPRAASPVFATPDDITWAEQATCDVCEQPLVTD